MAKIIISPQSERWSMRDWAAFYATRGYRVFPVYEAIETDAGWSCSCADGTACERPAKHPRTKNGFDDASSEQSQVTLWWTQWPNASIGIATGRVSNLTVVDADASKGKPGVVNLTALCAAHGGVPNTMIVATGGGGLHLYFAYTDRVPTGTDVLGEAIDVRNDGGYVIAPPSRHASGQLYKWRAREGDQLELPQWLVDAGLKAAKSGGSGGGEAGRRRGRPRAQPGFRLDRIESMLAVIDPDDRDRWLQAGVILGRLYVGSGLENDAWRVYETWACRSAKFDENRAGNIERMREMYHDRSQEAPRQGGQQIGVGSLISWAREAGWTPFGDRTIMQWEPGNEAGMCEELVQAMISDPDNTFFNIMGSVRSVIRTQIPIARMIQEATERGEPPPECLLVRAATAPALMNDLSRVAVIETIDRHGAPTAKPVPQQLAIMILDKHATSFPMLSGIAEWPLVGADGSLIVKSKGYDSSSGLYFDIDPKIKIDESYKPQHSWEWIKAEVLSDFPFDTEVDEAKALALMIAMMQRPMMKTCPAFGVTAPQAGTGKSTLIEAIAHAVHGSPIANHAFSSELDELRKAIHSLLLAKYPAVLFDNLRKGSAIDHDVIAKLLTSEVASDRTLGSSDTRKEVNSLLVCFTGNSVVFAGDMMSRGLMIKLNAKTPNPLKRKFRHPDFAKWLRGERNRVLSCLVSLVRAGLAASVPDGPGTRFEDFDRLTLGAVLSATGIDLRATLNDVPDAEGEDNDEIREAMLILWRWQQRWRSEANGTAWRVGELLNAIEAKTFEENASKILRRAVGDARAWELDAKRALGFWLRTLNGDHRFAPLVITSKLDKTSKSNKWMVTGGPELTANSTESKF